jgi:uncharacterized protein
MNSDEKKAMVTETVRGMIAGELDAVEQHLADDVSWTMAKSLSGQLPTISTKEQLMARSGGATHMFPDGLSNDITNVFCDGDTVIVEMHNTATTANGKAFDNEYCLVIALEDDKVKQIREYQDSLHVHQTFFS